MVTYRANIQGSAIPQGEPKHIMFTHPDWLSQDYDGKNSSDNRQYLDQAIPGVTDHTVNVCTDIARNYDVDGIHFDYIRYAEVLKDKSCAWGYNPIAVQRFNSLYRKEGKPEPGDPLWTQFRRQQLVDFLRNVYAHVKAVKWNVKMSAATTAWGELTGGFQRTGSYSNTLQDWPSWMESKLLDMNCIMNYMRENQPKYQKAYRDWAALGAQTKNGHHCIVGQAAYLNSVEESVAQLLAARAIPGVDGVLTYCYAETGRDGKASKTAAYEAFRDKVFAERADIPDAPWITKPQAGIIMGSVAAGGVKFDSAPVTLDGKTTRTDGTGFYAFLEVPAGEHSLEVKLDGYEPHSQRVLVTAGKVGQVAIDLKKK
jgi:uncharacterized lipoprotein YddW (UPF0748 family)